MSENVHGLIKRLEENLLAAADDVELRGRLAEAYLRVGDKKSAGQQYKEIGGLRLRRLQVQRAVEFLTKAMEQLPNDLTIQEQLYTIYRLAEQHEESVAVGTTLADQLRRARQFGRAEEILMRCLQVGGDRHDVRRVLAEVYVGMNAPEKAKQHLKHLAEHHPEERERRRFAQLAADLERKAAKQNPAAAKNNGAKSSNDRSGGGSGGGVKIAWLAAGLAAAAVCGMGISHQLAAQGRTAALAEASALAADGDLRAAAARLRESGLGAMAEQADRAAADARARAERAELAAARSQGLAPASDGGPTGLDTARRLAQEAAASDVRRGAEELAATLERAAAEADRLQRSVAGGDAFGTFSSWRALRDGGQLDGALAAAPELADGEVSLELITEPAGATVSDASGDVGVTPCTVTFRIGTGRELTISSGELSARVQCADAPAAKWEVPLHRAERWRVRVRGAVTGVARADGVLFVAGADGSLACVSADNGHERWRVTLGPGGDMVGTPAVAGDWVVVMVGTGKLAAFARADGTRGGPLDGLATTVPPLTIRGGVLLAQAGGRLVLARPGGGAPSEWGRLEGIRSLVAGRARIYGLTASGIAAFESGGKRQWRRDLEQALTGHVAEADDWLFLQLADGGCVVLGREGLPAGAGSWTRRATGAAVSDGTRILFGRIDGGVGEAVTALPAQSNEALRAPSEGAAVQHMTLAGTICYLADASGRLVAWAPVENTPRWTAALDGAPSIAPITDGPRVLVGLRNGVLLALAGESR